MAIKKLELHNYKGFGRFTVNFPQSGSSFLVGPNNAGKSTIIQALRGCGHMLDYALAKSPSATRRDAKRWVRAYPFGKDHFSLVTENVRHEFSPVETRLELTFGGGGILKVVWPEAADEESDDAFFYLESPNGQQLQRPSDVRKVFPRIGIIPTLTPIEAHENVLQPEYVKRHADGRLASRHFRNQLYLLRGDQSTPSAAYDAFIAMVSKWTPDIGLTELRARYGTVGRELDLFYKEVASRTEKEIYWSGDGLQIWFQFLLHMHRLREVPTIILDEPDVYLHADLQRRLVRVLEQSNAQTVTATHSAEILGEVGPQSVIWVDRTRRKAVRSPGEEFLGELSDSLGSQFNLRLARALRARVVLFVEGKDMQLLRRLAETVGADRLAAEDGVAVIQLEGFANWDRVPPFSWLINNLLEKSVPVFVVLDRDYRSAAATDEVVRSLKTVGVVPHIWSMKELESYLLSGVTIARLTGATASWVNAELDAIAGQLRGHVFARLHEARVRREVSKDKHMVTVTEEITADFEAMWSVPTGRLGLCPAKDVLSRLNERLADAGHKPTSFRAIARGIRDAELGSEVSGVLKRVEQAIQKSARALR